MQANVKIPSTGQLQGLARMISRKKFKKILDKDTSLAHDLKATFHHSANNWDIDAWLKYQELYPQQKSPRAVSLCAISTVSGVAALVPGGIMLFATKNIVAGALLYAASTVVLSAHLILNTTKLDYSTKHNQTIKALGQFARENRNANYAI